MRWFGRLTKFAIRERFWVRDFVAVADILSLRTTIMSKSSSLVALAILAALSPEVAANSFLRGLFNLNCSFNANGEVECDEPTYDNQEEQQQQEDESSNSSGRSISDAGLVSAIVFPVLALAVLVWWVTCRGGRRNNKSRAVKNFEDNQAEETESDEEESKQKEQPTTRSNPLRSLGSIEVESVASDGTDTKTGALCCSFS